MKKIAKMGLCLLLFVLTAAFGVACGSSDIPPTSNGQGSTPTEQGSVPDVELMDIEGVTFSDQEYVYDFGS